MFYDYENVVDGKKGNFINDFLVKSLCGDVDGSLNLEW